MIQGMEDEDGAVEVVPASRWRRAIAKLTDMAIWGTIAWLLRDRGDEARPSRSADARRWFARLAPLQSILAEQIGSPGCWLAGVQTVDRRTGRRVALWRTAFLVGSRAASEAVATHFQPEPPAPISEQERRQSEREIQDIEERFAGDEDGRSRALMEHYMRHHRPVTVNITRPLVVGVAGTVLNGRLRRRLAPTVLVRRWG
jgi:hypothetical protein